MKEAQHEYMGGPVTDQDVHQLKSIIEKSGKAKSSRNSNSMVKTISNFRRRRILITEDPPQQQ